MEFIINGIERKSGKRIALTVRADTREDAEAEADRWGLDVDQPQESKPEAAVRLRHPEYTLAHVTMIICFTLAAITPLSIMGLVTSGDGAEVRGTAIIGSFLFLFGVLLHILRAIAINTWHLGQNRASDLNKRPPV